jgi:hypothetical protein
MLFFNIILSYFSKKLHSDLLERVPITFLIMGLIILVLNLIGVLLMFENNDLEAHSDEESNGLINESPQFIFISFYFSFVIFY